MICDLNGAKIEALRGVKGKRFYRLFYKTTPKTATLKCWSFICYGLDWRMIQRSAQTGLD